MADGMIFKNTDGTRWGAGKGTRLTSLEVDLNFWELYDRLVQLEDNPPEAVNIASIVVIGAQFQVNMNDGSHFGPFDLPIAKFEWRGLWVNDGVYFKLDLVTVPQKGLYMLMFPHTAPHTGPFDEAATDVGSGDLIYNKVFGEDTYIYDFGFFYPGRVGIGIDDGAAMAGHILKRDVMLPADMGCSAKLKVASAADLSFSVTVDGVEKGTLDFLAGVVDGALTWNDDVPAPMGSLFAVIKPTAIDTDARELYVTFAAVRTT